MSRVTDGWCQVDASGQSPINRVASHVRLTEPHPETEDRYDSDGRIYRALDFMSGHTLKRLLATVGALWLARKLLLRQPIATQTAATAA